MPKISLVNQDINLDTIESLLKSQYSSDGYKIEKVSNRRIYLEKSVTDCFSIAIKNKGETTQVIVNGNLGGFFRSKAGRIIVIALVVLSLLFFSPIAMLFGALTIVIYLTNWRKKQNEILEYLKSSLA